LGYGGHVPVFGIAAEVGRGKWNPQRDTRPWIRFNLTAHYPQAGTVLRRSVMIKNLWDELEREIARKDLPDRVIGAVADAAMGLRVRSATYRHFAEVSKVVASRGLRVAVEAGLLVPAGERRGRIYRASEEIRAIAVKIHGASFISSVFALCHEPMIARSADHFNGIETQTVPLPACLVS